MEGKMSRQSAAMAVTNRGAFLAELDPFRASREEAALAQFRDQDGWGPKRPRKKAGDVWIIVGTLLGIVAGAIGGYQISPFVAILGIIAGGVIGALAGSGVTGIARRRRKARLLRDRPGAGRGVK
jgi:uncharacterized membrane protein